MDSENCRQCGHMVRIELTDLTASSRHIISHWSIVISVSVDWIQGFLYTLNFKSIEAFSCNVHHAHHVSMLIMDTFNEIGNKFYV